MSLNGTGGGRSPPSAASFSQSRTLLNNNYDIQFAFPKFGDLPGSNFMSNGSLAKANAPSRAVQQPAASVIPGVLRAQSSSSASAESSANPNGSVQVGSPEPLVYPSPTNTANDFEDLKGLFSPSILESISRSNSSDYMAAQGARKTSYPENQSSQNGVSSGASVPFHASPSASSVSNHGLDSSCGTTPEPSANSPDNGKGSEGESNAMRQGSTDLSKSAGETMLRRSFFPMSTHDFDILSAAMTFTNSPMYDVNGIDWMAQQNGGQFDPVLFGGYRDPHENILNNLDPNFFNDSFNDQDFSTPFFTGEPTSSAVKRDVVKESELRQNGTEDEVTLSSTSNGSLQWEKVL